MSANSSIESQFAALGSGEPCYNTDAGAMLQTSPGVAHHLQGVTSMVESTTIRGRRLGVLKTAAKRVGLSLEEYQERIGNGLKWCFHGQHWQPRPSFCQDTTRADGLAARCRDCASTYSRGRYSPVTGPRKYGPDPQPPRPGDKVQARQRINVEVRTGKRPHPNDLPCASCGHVHERGERRHEYHHHLGYDAAYHYDVIPLCTRCHHQKDNSNG